MVDVLGSASGYVALSIECDERIEWKCVGHAFSSNSNGSIKYKFLIYNMSKVNNSSFVLTK